MKETIENKLNYLLSIETKDQRLAGYIFTLKMALIKEEDYKKKLEYLKSMEVDNDYINGQIDALEWLVEQIPVKKIRR